MYTCSHSNIKHTNQCDPHKWCTNKSNAYILKHTHEVFCLNVIHVKASTPMYVYLRQGAQAGEDCGRQRGYLVLGKVKIPVGRREETVRRTLFRHRSAFACTSVRVRACQCVSAVQVRAYLRKQPRQSNTHTTTVIGMQNERNMHLKLRG
jgi:hypothetical protein